MSRPLATPPKYKSNPSGENNYVATASGWVNPATRELVEAIGNLAVRQGAGTVESVKFSPASKLRYKAGEVIELHVAYTEVATVVTTGGTPSIPIAIGGTNRTATYASGSGSNILVFRYTVQNTDTGVLVVSSPVSLNSGTIKSTVNNNNLPLTFTPPSATSFTVNGVAPTISSATLNSSAYTTGQPINVTLAMSASVTVTGTPQVALSVNGTTKQAVYTSGSGTNSLLFRYTVGAGDHATAGQFTVSSPVALNSGTILDSVGNAATLTFTPPTTSAVTVN